MKRRGITELLIRLLWFYFVGLWLGGLWLAAAWMACVTIIGIPLGIWMMHQAPAIMTLKGEESWETIEVGDRVAYVFEEMKQPPLPARAIWFVAVGWWLSLLWLKVAFVLAATFIGIPLAFWMINRLPFVMTLHRG